MPLFEGDLLPGGSGCSLISCNRWLIRWRESGSRLALVRELLLLPMNCGHDRTAASDSTLVRKMKNRRGYFFPDGLSLIPVLHCGILVQLPFPNLATERGWTEWKQS